MCHIIFYYSSGVNGTNVSPIITFHANCRFRGVASRQFAIIYYLTKKCRVWFDQSEIIYGHWLRYTTCHFIRLVELDVQIIWSCKPSKCNTKKSHIQQIYIVVVFAARRLAIHHRENTRGYLWI